jgi:ABC-2 type transport system permease protein
MDKVKRTLESLLATPLSLRQIWLGKSLAVTLPGTSIALLVSLLALLAMNLMLIVPNAGSFIMPNIISLVTGLIIMPVMAFFVVSLVGFLQLIMTNPRIANFVFIGIFLGIYLSTLTELAASWNFTFIYLIATIILIGLTHFIARFLTKERVILSSKG